tara:strand:+ start:329 stop:517 length:189 start_codon:yes stop_codon:yes gene_type:complete
MYGSKKKMKKMKYEHGGEVKAVDKMLKKGNMKADKSYAKLPGGEVMGQSPAQVSGRKWDGCY